MIVDSHQHFRGLSQVDHPWLTPELGPIHRRFGPAELEPQLRATGIDRTVPVQAANSSEDTDPMLARDWIAGVVGWVPLEDAETAASVLDERYLRLPAFKGVRQLSRHMRRGR